MSTTTIAPTKSPLGRSSEDRYEALFRVSRAISAHRDPQKLISVLAGELRSVIDFRFLSILLYDEKNHSMRPYVLHNVDGELEEFALQNFSPEETLTWWVHQHQQALVVPRVD